MKSALILMFALLAAGAQEKTYDLRLDSKPVRGHKSELQETSTMKMSMKITGAPEPISMAEETAFAAAEEVVSAEADGSCVLSWKFSKATKLQEGQTLPLSFQGKTVTVKHTKGKPREFSLEGGGVIAEPDLAALKKAFMGGEDKPDSPSGAEMFAPKKPVKVGESWSPDLKLIVKGMFDAEMAEAVDLEKSKSKFTLKSAESRSGADFGKIEGSLELMLGQLGPMKLDVPVSLKMTLNLDASIDGKHPDAVMRVKAEMKGKSSAAGPNGKIDLDLDMSMSGEKSVKTMK